MTRHEWTEGREESRAIPMRELPAMKAVKRCSRRMRAPCGRRFFRVASSMLKRRTEHSLLRMKRRHCASNMLSQSTAIHPRQPALVAHRLLSALRERWTGFVQDSSARLESVASKIVLYENQQAEHSLDWRVTDSAKRLGSQPFPKSVYRYFCLSNCPA